MPRIAVALSGGGHRSCAFGLGAMLYLAHAELTGSITSVASVSGGSLANAAIAQDVDLKTCSADELAMTVARVARRMTGLGTLFGTPITWLYLLALAAGAAATFAGPWLLPLDLLWKILVLVGALVALWVLVHLRGRVCALAFRRTVFKRGPKRLRAIHTGVDHVICATDLHAGENVYFSGDFVYAYRFGVGTPGNLALHRAVQASAAFPGAFPVSWMRRSRFGFKHGRPEARAWFLALHDGGVYDNMADQWLRELDERNRRPGVHFEGADQLIVVNGSAGLAWKSMWKLWIPWAGELAALIQDKSVLYDNGNSVRRQELITRFDQAARDDAGLRGALVHIAQTPLSVPAYFEEHADAWPKRAQRSATALAHLRQQGSDDEWKALARPSAGVPTTLLGLKRAVIARLLRHAYVQAMVNLHVILDYPLLEIPTTKQFEEFVESG
jgi:predicted acylesterase/phospholipase RssA